MDDNGGISVNSSTGLIQSSNPLRRSDELGTQYTEYLKNRKCKKR